MAAILTAEDVARRIAAECAYVGERGGVGIRLEPAAAIVRQYGEQFRRMARRQRRPRQAKTPALIDQWGLGFATRKPLTGQAEAKPSWGQRSNASAPADIIGTRAQYVAAQHISVVDVAFEGLAEAAAHAQYVCGATYPLKGQERPTGCAKILDTVAKLQPPRFSEMNRYVRPRPALQISYQGEDLRLHRHIESRGLAHRR